MSVKRKTRKTKPAKKNISSKRPLKRASVGSSFSDFLREEGLYEETQAVAIKRVIAWRLAEEMQKQNITKAEMARRMETSRSQLDRLLDPQNADVKLDTLARAARAVDCELRLELAAAA